ncbi:MAG: hypothetical protein EPO52_06815 [Herbiconiux sp.]|uniref:hypothetical protein n=1 Tax=Herbiconiux sp. TaxID=1871186 RepID=UPI0012080F34|nr:hypothetical protein [Herbiconiux sp.]TAJ47899.1 MAG: hypothetical protein EPO52_06815 [Herbiconiux sp.]
MSDPSDAAPPAPAGWYDDGSGRQRWWTGDDWSDRFQDGLGPVHSLPKSTRCPICGSLDRVQMVGMILQQSTTLPHRALALRLAPPPRPRPPVGPWALWFTLGGLALALITGGAVSGSLIGAVLTGIYLLLPIVLAAWGLAGLIALIARPHFRRLQGAWDKRAAVYYRSLYCLRDDTMFSAGSPAERPEEGKARTFWG